jgi:hypothetical protein
MFCSWRTGGGGGVPRRYGRRALPWEREPLPAGPPATPAGGPGAADDPLLTIDEVTAELRVSRAAFCRWRRRKPARRSRASSRTW